MKYGLVYGVTRRALGFGMGVLAAAAFFGGAQAWAQAGSSATTAKPVVAPATLTIMVDTDYQQAVLDLALRGISNRTEDPYFSRSSVVTRVQMAVYLARTLRLSDIRALSFDDVGAGHWGYSEIGAVSEAGLMQGTAPGAFSPDASVSRQEAAALIVAALRYSAEKQGAASSDDLSPSQVEEWLAGFQDRNFIDPQYTGTVAVAYRIGLFDMPEESWLLPRLAVTHEELLGMLDRAFVGPVAASSSFPTAVAAVDAYPDLASGSTGTLVLLLQQRLTALNYPCGTPDGKYSSHTRDAVYAFEKYERLKRTGKVDQTVWDALFAATAPVAVYQGDTGRRVEVDLTRQIMMLIEENKVVMTIHVSTGRYGTPTGDWHIRTLSHGWRMCSLGPIYSPCYFMPRNAIHGYPSVPTYPASHGCIRTPIWIQDKIVDHFEMGELVHVFYNKLETAA
jgi:N-acetylmuramoyl-L-alanine amidase